MVSPDSYSLAPFLERRAIFVHIPKCAGIAVAQALFGCRAGAHHAVRDYRIIFSAEEYAASFKFAFVRDPWDRFLSAYHFLMQGGIDRFNERDAQLTVRRYPSLGRFVRDYMVLDDYRQVLHLRPQSDFVTVHAGGPPELDFIGRFETLAADFAAICARLGIENRLRVANRGQRRQERATETLDDEERRIIGRCYEEDIENFRYGR